MRNRRAGSNSRRSRWNEGNAESESARRVQEAVETRRTERSVQEWVDHPSALLDLLTDMGAVTKRWREATDERRCKMIFNDWRLYWANKNADNKFGIHRINEENGLTPRELDWTIEVLAGFTCADCGGRALFCGCVSDAMSVDLTKCDGPRNREASASLARAVVAAGVQPGVDDRDHT